MAFHKGFIHLFANRDAGSLTLRTSSSTFVLDCAIGGCCRPLPPFGRARRRMLSESGRGGIGLLTIGGAHRAVGSVG